MAQSSGQPLSNWEPKLERLMAFGRRATEFNFEWPTQFDISKWPFDRKIKMSRIKTNWTSLRSFQMTLTPNLTSPTMQASELGNVDKEYVMNVQGAPITSVSVKLTGQMQIYGIKFTYSTGDVHVLFEADGGLWKEREIPKGKQIVGFYGNADEDRINTLGFIVWTPNPNAL